MVLENERYAAGGERAENDHKERTASWLKAVVAVCVVGEVYKCGAQQDKHWAMTAAHAQAKPEK